MEIIIPYTPHSNQLILHNDNHRYKSIVCGRRWGKTIFAVNELIKKAMTKSNTNYWYVAPTYSQAKMIAWQKFKYYSKDIPKKINEAELLITFCNGSTIRLVGSDNADNLRGVGLDGVVLDEFADIRRDVWQLVIRPTLTEKQGWAIFLGTPKGKLNQLYEMFIKDEKYYDDNYRNFEGEKIESSNNYSSYRFLTKDNPYIPEEEIETARKELALQYFKQEYEASFENYTGLIYKEFNITKHIIKRENFELKDWYNIYVGIDTGRYTAISFVAMDEKGITYLFDEIYDFDGIVSDIAKKIKLVLAKNKIDISKVRFIIDSASQVKNEYKYNSIHCYDAKKDIENQIAIVRNAFAKNILFFCDNCEMHNVEHQGYIWDIKAKTPKPKDENDHTCNSLQYIFSTYSLIKSIDTEKIKKYEQSLEYVANQKDYDEINSFY